MKIFILLAMIFCHIVDDYYLQGILAKMKQKQWWKNLYEFDFNEDEYNKYKFDYIVALIMHSFSWSFMIMLPIAIALHFNLGWLFLAYPIHTIIHCVVDDLKANKHKINLIVDQSIHMAQVIITWVIYYLVF